MPAKHKMFISCQTFGNPTAVVYMDVRHCEFTVLKVSTEELILLKFYSS